jgi:hypothetical protein
VPHAARSPSTATAGGNRADDKFMRRRIKVLGFARVTWAQSQVPGESLARAVKIIEKSGRLVIDAA